MSQLNVTTLKHESAGVDNITLDANGRVGIGTSSPATPLDVTKANGGNFVATFQNTSSSTPYGVFIKDAPSGANGYPLLTVTNSAGAHYFRVDSGTGYVTMPYQPCFSAWHASAGATSTAGTVLSFDSTLVNVGNHYSTSTNRFTAPVAGIYQFSWTALHRDATVQCVSLYKNGTNIWQQGPLHVTNHNVAEVTLGATVFLNVAAGDYFDVRVFSISGGSVFYGHGHANFTGRLVG